MNTKHTLKYAEEPGLDDLFVVKRFNEWQRLAKKERAPKQLCGELWLEGEIAVMTADHGAGKSLLAVQIANAIAGGEPVDPFEMTAEPQAVVYMNLKQSERQFAMRYCSETEDADDGALKDAYEFSDKLHRFDMDIHGKLPEGFRSFADALPALVERAIAKTGAKVVIIDNITYLQRSVYGYGETYTVMKELHRLRSQLGISILVLARSSKYGSVRESTAGSCSALFSRFADSVFMIGMSMRDPAYRYIKQLIVHSSAKIYNESNVPWFWISRWGGNFLSLDHFGFDAESDHNQPFPEKRLWPTIEKVKKMSDKGVSVRSIAKALDLPKSNIQRYLHMWTDELGFAIKEAAKRERSLLPTPKTAISGVRETPPQPSPTVVTKETPKATPIKPKAQKPKGRKPRPADDPQTSVPTKSVNDTPDDKDPVAKARSSCKGSQSAWRNACERGDDLPGLTYTRNDLGTEMWIEERDHRGKPVIWYLFSSKGRKEKCTRDSWGVSMKTEAGPLVE